MKLKGILMNTGLLSWKKENQKKNEVAFVATVNNKNDSSENNLNEDANARDQREQKISQTALSSLKTPPQKNNIYKTKRVKTVQKKANTKLKSKYKI